MLEEHREDAELLGVIAQYRQLAAALKESLETIPFPEEATVSQDDVIGGVFKAVLGGASVERQIKKRVDSLLSRYENWWRSHRAQITQDLGNLQSALIDRL